MNVADRYAAIAAGFDRRVHGCAAGDWSSPTPCAEWSVRDIVEHVVGVHRRVLAYLTDAETGVPETGVPAQVDELVRAWTEASTVMRAALDDPVSAERMLATPFGEMAFADLVGRMVSSDTLVHTWDIAQATGQDEALDPTAVTYAWTWMEPAGDRLRQSGSFGPALDPPPDADTQQLLLCFLGRDPTT